MAELPFGGVKRNVSASTQNQALSALLFLYQKVLHQRMPWMDEIGRPQNFTTGGDFSLLMLLAENFCDAGSLMRRELVDRVTAWFVPAVIGAAAGTFLIWLTFGPSPALTFAIRKHSLIAS